MGHRLLPAAAWGIFDDGVEAEPDVPYCARCARALTSSGEHTITTVLDAEALGFVVCPRVFGYGQGRSQTRVTAATVGSASGPSGAGRLRGSMTMRRHPRTAAGNRHITEVTKGHFSPCASVAAQIARNAQAHAELAEEFGLRTGAEVAARARANGYHWLGPAKRWRRRGLVFAVEVCGQTRYPGFQFDAAGRPQPIIAAVIEAFGTCLTGWELALWFTGANDWLGGLRPVDVLNAREDVVAAARRLRAELLT